MWNSKSSVAVACFFPGRAKDLSAPLYFLSGRRTSCLKVSKLCLNCLHSVTVTHTDKKSSVYGHESLKIEGRYLQSISYAKSTVA